MPAALETSTTTTSTMASSGVAPAATMEDVSSAGVTSTAAVATMSASSASALLTDEEYVRQVDLHFFLQDAISLFTAACHTSPSITPAEYFEQYFAAVLNGTFILGRPYTFLCRNVLTRRAFVSVFHTSFSHLSPHDVLSVDDVHQLCCLLCPDFPLSVVRNASRIAANIEASVDMPFGTLCHNFLLLFFFSSYLTDAALIFRSLDTEQAGVVSVPLLRRVLLKARSKQEKKRISMPSTDAVESVLRSAARVVPATLQAAARSSIAAAPSSETIGHDAASAATQPVAVAAAAAHHTIMFNAFCSALFRVPSVVEQCMPASMIVEQPVPVSSSLPPPSPSPSPDAPNVPSVEDVSNEAAPAADEQS